MVTTRRSGANEPLEHLETPPKRTRKSKPKKPVSLVCEASPEVIQAVPMEAASSLSFQDVPVTDAKGAENLTPAIEQTTTNTTSAKRRHEDDEAQDASPTKRARTQPISAIKDDNYLFMFPKKHTLEEDLEEPPKSLVSTFRRNRALRAMNKKNGRFGGSVRLQGPVKLIGDNPFGIETFTQQELAEQAAAQQPKEPTTEREKREERSAAPEPETPRRGLFGSLREIGSATVGRILSPFGRSNIASHTNTAPQPRTEPQKRVRVWDIEYPQLSPNQNENALPDEEQEEEETESERKRREFEAKFGRTSRKYDHLHTTPIDGNPENLPYPVKKKPESASQPDTEQTSSELLEFSRRRKERREALHGKRPVKQIPTMAPLFGPNSHYARGTRDPIFDKLPVTGDLPAPSKLGNKRTLEEALPEEATAADKQPPRSFQPSAEDEADSVEDGPSTPLAKKQKTTAITQTPRSALKAPGSMARSGRSARFNPNPIASVKHMSPISGTAPAGEYSPDNLFLPRPQDSPGSDHSFSPSPNTQKNTVANTGEHRSTKFDRRHPGDEFTTALNAGQPYVRVDYTWKDSQDPNWRPSLHNPQPGCIRLLDDDEEEIEMQRLAALEREHSSMSPESAPEAPPTPRMSHAELPKSPAPSASSIDAQNAFEAANLERRRADATKTKPRKSSRLAEVTSARSRSPSPPGLDTSYDAGEGSDSSVKTPSPTLDTASNIWTWNTDTNEYISSVANYPDFAYNPYDELIPAFALKTATGEYDDTVVGPDGMTELQRQNHYKNIYNDEWAEKTFKFDPPQTYEEAGVGSKHIHDLIRKTDAQFPELVRKCDERNKVEWDAHQQAIDNAMRQGKVLKATYPDRDEVEMLDDDEL